MNSKKLALILTPLLISSCTVFLGAPKERVDKFEDWELCTELANKTFKYHSQWHWAITNEIKSRELNNSAMCRSAYDARMGRFSAKRKIVPISFQDALAHKF